MKRKNKFIIKKAFLLLIIVCVIAISLAFTAFALAYKAVDFSIDEALFLQAKVGNVTKFYYNRSRGDCYTPEELTSIEPEGNRKSWYSFDDIGDNLKSAFICAEDRNFYQHKGVDGKRTVFAIINYFLHIKPRFGGSSITQQVIKNISGDNDLTPKRKVQEMIRATHIENSHSKEEIFEVYMNVIPMGERICGVGLAARHFFGKEPAELSYAEAATLVGIANAPSKYNPHTKREDCIKKRNNVLYSMRECESISIEEYKKAINEELSVIPRSYNESRIYSWFTETVCDDIVRDLVKEKGITENAARILILNGGLSVYTTQDPRIQTVLDEYFENSSNFPEAINDGLDYSMVITDSKNGDLLGIVGSAGEKKANRILNNATELHPPGSALKPIALYAPALDLKIVNWATVFDDVPVTFDEKTDGTYYFYPQNSPKVYDGLIPLSEALRTSKNTVAVRLYKMLGKDYIFSRLVNDYGFDIIKSKKTSGGKTISDLGPSSLALGQLSYGISLRKLTEAYTAFSGDGILKKGRSYVAVYDSAGNLLLENQASEKEVFSTETARIMNKMLEQVVESGTAKSITLKNIVDTAGKTGTSGNDKDRYFIGYTPYFTAGIRCGYNDNRSIGHQTVSHFDIWDQIMLKLHEEELKNQDSLLTFSTDGLEHLSYCRDSGLLYSDVCIHDPRGERIMYGYFTGDNKPNVMCDKHIICKYDRETGEFIESDMESDDIDLFSLLKIENRNLPLDIEVSDSKYILENHSVTYNYDINSARFDDNERKNKR